MKYHPSTYSYAMQWSRHYWNESTTGNPLWYGWETCCCIIFNLFYGCEMRPQSPILSLWSSQKFQRTRSEEYVGWNLFLQEQLLISVWGMWQGRLTWCSITLFFLLFWSCKPICIRHQFHHHRLSWCHNRTNFGHIYSLPHLTLPHHHPVQMAETGFIPQRSNFIHILATMNCTAF